MIGSLQTLVEGAFDYAGLFPPAMLSMENAVAEHVAFQTAPAGSLMNRFICPVGSLDDFWSHASKTRSTSPWRLTVLGSSLEALRPDLKTIQEFSTARGESVLVEGYEVRSGPGVLHPELLKPLANAGFDDMFIELPWSAEQQDSLHLLAEFEVIGAKVRMGGADASAYPGTAAVAEFLQECINLDLAFKLTAGLHHPFRRKHPTIDAHEHGFLNVLVAGCIALVEDLSRGEIEKILREENPEKFWFRESELGWGDYEVTVAEIQDFRDLFTTIGSCSISEPYEDLKSLELVR